MPNRPADRRERLVSDARGGLVTFLIEAGVVALAIVIALAIAALVLLVA